MESNILTISTTIIAVIASGIVSFIISKKYFDKANRCGLEMNVILPIKKILSTEKLEDIFRHIKQYSGAYYLKYLNRAEKEAWSKLYLKFGKLTGCNEIRRITNIVDLYFESKLEENGISKCFISNMSDEGVVEEYEVYEHHIKDIGYMNNLESILQDYDVHYQEEECQKAFITFFDWCCEELYGGINIKYFQDKSLYSIIEESPETKEWNEKLYNANEAKENFLKLNVCKELID